VKPVRTKLSIQAIVYCSVVYKRNLYYRWMFNHKQISIEISVYQNNSENENFKSMPWNLVGIVGLIRPRAY
jgi:hypothetical protein